MSLFLFYATEDGGRIAVLGERGSQAVEDFLQDPQGTYGVSKFLNLGEFLRNTDPMYWNDGRGFLIEGDAIVPLPALGVRLP